MKKLLIILMVVAMASFLFVGCLPGVTPPDDDEEDVVVTIAAIPGVTAPVTGATPVTAITATAQYTGVVAWSPVDTTFAAATAYTATITLTAKTGYTLTGVAADFFTVADATTDTNLADSGVVTAVFAATAAVPTSATPVLTAVQESDGTSIFTVTSTSTLYMNEDEAGSSILVKGTAPSESLVTIYIDDVAVVGAVGETAVTGLWTVAVAESSLGADGVKVMTAKVTEVGLAESAASNAVTFTLDTVDPGIDSIAATAAASASGTDEDSAVVTATSGTDPISTITLDDYDVVPGTWTILCTADSGNVTAEYNVVVTTPANVATSYNISAGISYGFITGFDTTLAYGFKAGDGCDVVVTEDGVTAAITAKATITFDEDVTDAGMAAGTYTLGGDDIADPTNYSLTSDTGYWTTATGAEDASLTITVYGITDAAGNVGGTSASPLSATCTIGAASSTLLAY